MRQDYKAKLVLTEQQYNQKIVSLLNGFIFGNVREFDMERQGIDQNALNWQGKIFSLQTVVNFTFGT